MAYLDDEDAGGPANPAAKVGGVLAAMAVAMLVKFLWTGNIFGVKEEWTAARFDTELTTDSRVGELYRAIKAAYPVDYQAFIGEMPEVRRAGGMSAVDVRRVSFQTRLLADHLEGLRRAPSHQLIEIAGQFTALVGMMQQTDVALCAQFVRTGLSPGIQPRREVVTLMNHIDALQISASRVGEAQASVERRPNPSEEDLNALRSEVGRRSPEAARLLSNASAMNAATESQQCAVGLAYYQAVQTLPVETAARVMVTILSTPPPPSGS